MWREQQLKHNSRIQETPISSTTRREQFATTRIWKELLRKFSIQVPQQNHKRQLRNYPDTFTGKEALDCMDAILPKIFANKNCTRDTAKKVLENYLESKYIANIRDENNKQFLENATLYSLCNDHINKFLGDSCSPINKIRRRSINRTSSVRENGNQQLLQSDNSHSTNWKTHIVFDSSESGRLNGRLSVSCQDISLKESPPHSHYKTVHNNLSGFIADSISKASASILSLHRSSSQTNTRSKRTNPKFLSDSVFKENLMQHIPQATFTSNNNFYPTKASKSIFQIAVSSSHVEPIRKPQKAQPNFYPIKEFKHTPYPKESDISNSTTFCDRIDKSTYEQQSRTLEPHLHMLLDMILSNENLSPVEKFEKLKAFRVSYPSIYAQKFPAHADPLEMNEREEPTCNTGTQDNIGSSLIRHIQNFFF